MISLTLFLPPSINRTNRAGINWTSGKIYRAGSDDMARYKGDVRILAVQAGVADSKPTGPLSLTVHWYFRQAGADHDGPLKLLQDALALALGFNDKMIVEYHAYKAVDRRRPRVEIELKELKI